MKDKRGCNPSEMREFQLVPRLAKKCRDVRLMTACTADPSGQGASEELLLNMSAWWRSSVETWPHCLRFSGKLMNVQLGWKIWSSRIFLSHSSSLMKVGEADAIDAVCNSNECFQISKADSVCLIMGRSWWRRLTLFSLLKKKTTSQTDFHVKEASLAAWRPRSSGKKRENRSCSQ